MKKKLYIKTALLSLVSMAMLSSCLKDDSHFVNFAGSKPLVELPAATGVGPSGGFITPIALPIQTTPQNLSLLVNVAAPKPLSTALTVKLTVDAAALTAYNVANSTSYTLLPAAFYTIPSLSVTIPANQNSANLNFTVTTSGFDLTQNYILPFTIVDGGGQQISNYKTVFYFIQPKNQYDGIYVDNGYSLRLGDPVRTGNFTGANITLITSGANSVVWSPVWADGSGVAGVGSPTITVNADNTVTNTAAANGTWTNAGGYNNRYVPATKTFYISTVWSTPGTRATTDTLVYSGPR